MHKHIPNILLLAHCLVLSSSALLGQTPPASTEPSCDPASVPPVTIPLNNTGVADFKFMNPRRPFALVRGVDDPKVYRRCLDDVDITFSNETAGRTFVISVPFSIRTETSLSAELGDTIDEIRQTILGLEKPDLDDVTSEVEEQEQDLVQVKSEVDQQERELAVLRRELHRLLRRLERLERGEEAEPELEPEPEPEPEASAPLTSLHEGADPAPEVVEIADRAPDAYGELTRIAAEVADIQQAQDERGQESTDEGKISSLDELIERAYEAFRQSAPYRAEPLVAAQEKRLKALIVQAQRTLRTYRLLLGKIDKQCSRPKNGTRQCSFQITIPPGSDYPLSIQEWEPVYSSANGTVEVEVAFFDEAGTPSNNKAYLKTEPKPAEPPSKTTWSLLGRVGSANSPELDADPSTADKDPFTPDRPYLGNVLRRATGLGRIDLEQTLGTRARAKAELTFKTGDLGAKDQEFDLEATQYTVDVFADNGLTFRFGRYGMAAPSDKIAVNESGEGFEFVIPSSAGVSVGYIIKRESLTGVADDADRDSTVAIVQGRNLSLDCCWLDRGSFIALYGAEEKENQTPYEYATAGGEVFFSYSKGLDEAQVKAKNQAREAREARERGIQLLSTSEEAAESRKPWSFSGSLALYRSDRDVSMTDLPAITEGGGGADTSPGAEGGGEEVDFTQVVDGEGTVGLVSLRWNQVLVETKGGFIKTTFKRSVGLRFGYGTGNDPSTGTVDEGYLGETASFAPDKLFLASFASRIDAGDAGPVGSGLSNKTYFELSYSDNTWTPLQYIARRLAGFRDGDPESKDPVISQTTTFKAHAYRFVEKVFGSSDAGFELGLDFEIQSPKGVKNSLGIGKLFVGEALESIIRDDPFIVTTQVSVTLK